ncbi:MAG: hypothetical protein ACKOJH_13480 [Actinomycetota bacterium]
MSKSMYLLQAFTIGAVMFALVRQQPLILRLQVLGWTIGVSAIMWRYGVQGQLNFYSNDQNQYAAIVRILMTEALPRTPQWWIEFSKIPFPLAAYPLALSGVHVALALKTVSLVCILVLTSDLLKRYETVRFFDQVRVTYITGCGLIGLFFSLLALRETMMMYFVFRYVTDRSIAGRVISLIILFLLRSHLAAALVLAEVVLAIWKWMTNHRSLGFGEPLALIVGGATLGTMLFSWRFASINNLNGLAQIKTPFSGNYGIAETLQVASNYAGLQFLTAHEAYVKMPILDLLLLRVVFSDTVLIPLGFTIACLLLGPSLRERHRFTLLAFSIYVSVVTNTDFNSFRQNIPFMPLMGVVILDAIHSRRVAREKSVTNSQAGALLLSGS